MNDQINNGSTTAGTAGGLLTVMLVKLNAAELVNTVVLAGTGAIVSFFVSWFLKQWISKRKAKRPD